MTPASSQAPTWPLTHSPLPQQDMSENRTKKSEKNHQSGKRQLNICGKNRKQTKPLSDVKAITHCTQWLSDAQTVSEQWPPGREPSHLSSSSTLRFFCLLLNTMLYGIKYPFGQFRSGVPAVSTCLSPAYLLLLRIKDGTRQELTIVKLNIYLLTWWHFAAYDKSSDFWGSFFFCGKPCSFRAAMWLRIWVTVVSKH